MQVVIADDEPITRMDLKEILEKEGHQVVAEAADGFDAIECCRDCHPDLVVMDVKMPLLDGITASKVIAEEDLAETVVLLTAYCDREFIEEAKEAKVSGYFVKPVEERTFLPESRAVVEQAKGLIMNKRGMTEQEAYDYIRNISRMKNISMKKVAEIILMGRGK